MRATRTLVVVVMVPRKCLALLHWWWLVHGGCGVGEEGAQVIRGVRGHRQLRASLWHGDRLGGDILPR